MGTVDWSEIRRRVDAAGLAAAAAPAVSQENARDVLEERSRRLARVPETPQDTDTIEAITFSLSNEIYAIEARYVLEVFRLVDISLLPGAKPPLYGVTAWRGELLTIVDLRGPLGLSVTALNDLSRVIVLGEVRGTLGILADAVRDIVALPVAAVREPPEGVAAHRTYLRGITGDAMLVLDATALLGITESHSS
jgi:purine-binding chemotaxis protein CheW